MIRQPRAHRAQTGFSLIETLVATALTITALVSLAQVVLIAARALQEARLASLASVLAQQKMEELRALAWGFDAEGLHLSDEGLAPSPADAMARNVAGYCEFLDERGERLGDGTDPPAGTAFVRRWSIAPLESSPDNTVILQVLVARRDDRVDARLVGIKTRKAG
jgi:type II secretory pathway pseudopilin PulG